MESGKRERKIEGERERKNRNNLQKNVTKLYRV